MKPYLVSSVCGTCVTTSLLMSDSEENALDLGRMEFFTEFRLKPAFQSVRLLAEREFRLIRFEGDA